MYLVIYSSLRFNALFDVPNDIGNMKSLKSLDLLDNYLEGLPDSMGSLVSLKSL